ncbi:DapA Dihydrodipicolinate synthase/N-acetylneuraminate lyase [Rhabdaerophilaceae bacterium]
MLQSATIRGVWPVLCTPFTQDGAIDPVAMRRVARFACDASASGVVFPGFASEVDELTPDERVALLKTVLDEIGGAVPVLAGASAPSLSEVISRVSEAGALGVDAVMIQAPKSVGSDAAAVTAFYGAISNACPTSTIVLQNAPAPRGSDLSPKAVIEVARAVPAIRYIKEETIPSGGPISAILAGAPDHLVGVIGGGGARFVVDEFLRGAGGAMPAVEFTDVHARMWKALEDGQQDEARLLYERILPLLMIQSHARMRLTKRVLMHRGILANDVVRAKILAFDERDLAEIEALLSRISDLFGVAPLKWAAE